jgi:heat-inducible transcriptional repressor
MPTSEKPVLTERRKQILGAVVDMHIRTAQPVGSKPLVLEYRLRISPATVRLEFAALERMGLIFQPHTSAGRVPSDMGYRVFVDEILQTRPLPPHQLRSWEQQFARRYGEVRDLLVMACQLLSQCTNYAAFAVLPRRQSESVRGIHFSLLPDNRVVVMVAGHRLLHKTVLMPTIADAKQWQQVTHWLNMRLQGLPFSQLLWLQWEQIAPRGQESLPLLRTAFDLVKRLTEEAWQAEIWLEGLSKVLREPEFQRVEQAQRLIAFWESPQKLAAWLEVHTDRAIPPVPKAWVYIGAEIPFAELSECSLVAAPCFWDEIPVGLLGVFGPKRMRYGEVIPIVEGVAKLLSSAFSALS